MKLTPGKLYKSTHPGDNGCIFRINSVDEMVKYTILASTSPRYVGYVSSVEKHRIEKHTKRCSQKELAEFKAEQV